MRALIVAVLLLGFASGASARTWLVDQYGGGDFVTIQAAIEAGSSGDEIIVNPGRYVENIDFIGKDLYLHSASGPSGTIIDGGDVLSCVVFRNSETPDAVLEGLQLTGGVGTLFENVVVGGAIFCLNSSPTIHSCEIVGNEANYAAGIYVDQADPEIFDCVFRSNVAARYGGGIAGPDARPFIHDCLFENNYAGTGDGTIHLALNSQILRCVFRGNEARSGGAINSGGYGADFTIQDCIFVGNRAHGEHGGAIRVHEAVNVQIERCLFVGNTAVVDAGGILAIDGATPSIRNCTFDQNGASRYGGAIAAWTGSRPGISNCIIANSIAGGGIAAQDMSAPAFLCDDAWNNAGGNYVGEISDPTGEDGNISEDPIFCDPISENYGIRDDSPCAPEFNPDCGLVGAYEVRCQKPTPTRQVTWGQVRLLYH